MNNEIYIAFFLTNKEQQILRNNKRTIYQVNRAEISQQSKIQLGYCHDWSRNLSIIWRSLVKQDIISSEKKITSIKPISFLL